jgi:hypothetical protein
VQAHINKLQMIAYLLTNIDHQVFYEKFGIHIFREFVIVFPYPCGFT